MNDYERIATAIRLLDSDYQEQPDHRELAEHLGLSEFHFHRLFSRWAGITPKAFLRCLTITHAKKLLHAGERVLETSLDLGLSGPGRLHDLCVELESASPGELQSGGEGWTINYGSADSPFGRVFIAESPRGICQLSFINSDPDERLTEQLQATWPKAKLSPSPKRISSLAERIFPQNTSTNSSRPLKALVHGTSMQLKVWRALLQIPPGSLTTYGALAKAINHPGAARATGTAVGANPLAYIIPCHRVIRATGVIGDYRWGTSRKKALIAYETAPRE